MWGCVECSGGCSVEHVGVWIEKDQYMEVVSCLDSPRMCEREGPVF